MCRDTGGVKVYPLTGAVETLPSPSGARFIPQVTAKLKQKAVLPTIANIACKPPLVYNGTPLNLHDAGQIRESNTSL